MKLPQERRTTGIFMMTRNTKLLLIKIGEEDVL